MQRKYLFNFRNMKWLVALITLLLVAAYGGISILGDMPGDEVLRQAYGKLTYSGKALGIDSPLYFVTGRLYVPFYETISGMGGVVTGGDESFYLSWKDTSCEVMAEDDEHLYKQLQYIDDKPYIYIYDLAVLCNLSVTFNSAGNIVSLYGRQADAYENNDETEKIGEAYLRLEDFTADYGISGNFTDGGLEKLRVIADYLHARGQAYQIAWIPLYTNPSRQMQNDLTSNFDFYNAGFIYTLDYIVNHSGKIALHGLTHQENDTISAIGTEFGPNSPYSDDEIENRMLRAKEIAKTLGFDNDTFEFPHYSFTKKQLKIAERHFAFICQQHPYVKTYGFVERVRKLHGTVTYIPTPLGYVYSAEELESVIEKIENNTQFKGIFMHPYIDFTKISCYTDKDGFRSFSYDESGIIPQLVSKITEYGYLFSNIN